ncbi:TauD/TfdA family dioxygenase [Phenylobacterium sp. LjRoot225]|uniref:TauD/TfdA dioxygenase family protein n=1 Tax=Phenylobacterium sp. LjRoot225 TaxID=3342285 RepID=UPI003ECC8107
MDGWVSEEGLSWRALAPFGVEIDCDLSAPHTPARSKRLAGLIARGGYVLARGQALSMEQQIALMAPIGPIIRRPQENGYISTDAEAASSRSELSFHADAAYTDAPFAALSLHAMDVVDDASGTRFVNAERGYATLPAELRDRLDRASAEMISPTLSGVGVRACDVREPEATQRATFPAVRLNPRTGRRCIGVSEMHTARLLDMDWEASRDLLGAVYDHLYAPGNSTEHLWRRGDIVIWDNLTLQHARGSLNGVGRRVLQRVVAGA